MLWYLMFIFFRWSWKVASCSSLLPLKVTWLNSACGRGLVTAMVTGSSFHWQNAARSSLLQSMTGQRRQREGEEQWGWELIRHYTWGACPWTSYILLWTAEVTNTVRYLYICTHCNRISTFTQSKWQTFNQEVFYLVVISATKLFSNTVLCNRFDMSI